AAVLRVALRPATKRRRRAGRLLRLRRGALSAPARPAARGHGGDAAAAQAGPCGRRPRRPRAVVSERAGAARSPLSAAPPPGRRVIADTSSQVPIVPRSSTATRTPRRARWYAALAPKAPEPTTTTSAERIMRDR